MNDYNKYNTNNGVIIINMTKVFIDGKQAENLTNGGVQKYNLSEGTHQIVLKSFGKDDVVYDIDTTARSYTISCVLTPRGIVSTIE